VEWRATRMDGNSGNNKGKAGERGRKGMEFWLASIATNAYATARYFLGLTNMGTI